MTKFVIALMAVMMLSVTGCATNKAGGASAAAPSQTDNSGLPEIAAYDEESYDLLADVVSVDDVVADASDEVMVADDGSMPEITAYDDEAYDLLPDMVSAQ